jgi:P4 family phage/plasmid primase-like protien
MGSSGPPGTAGRSFLKERANINFGSYQCHQMDLARFSPFPKVQRLLRLLGADEGRGRTPVLVAIPAKQKGPVTPGWSAATWDEHMQDAGYLASVEAAGNFGVILGKQSGPLATIDIDVDESVGPFLEANPRLRNGLRTRGSKGCQIWMWLMPDDELRFAGPDWVRGFPDRRMNLAHISAVKEVPDGQGGTKKTPLVVMEWRAGANQSVVQGIHPDGMCYQMVVEAPPVEISFRDIVWPEWLGHLPWIADWAKALSGKLGPLAAQLSDEALPVLSERGIAAMHVLRERTLFAGKENQFYVYEPAEGLWKVRPSVRIQDGLAQTAHELSIRGGAAATPELRPILDSNLAQSARFTGAAAVFVKAAVAVEDPFGVPHGRIHLLNGMLDVRTGRLEPFSASWMSRNQIAIAYDPTATCPRIENELLGGLNPADRKLMQLMAGQFLLGRNLAQRLVVITGEQESGKSQFAALLKEVVGSANYAQLRTDHLGQRFEAEGFIGKTFLLGTDVPRDFLSAKSATLLKTLTGGDPLQAEIKGGGKRVDLNGSFNVMVTSNAALNVRLEDDVGAWRRRLLVVPWKRGGGTKKVTDFANLLFRTEGSGFVNWSAQGARELLAVLDSGRTLCDVLTQSQRDNIDRVLGSSDSVRIFVRKCLVAVPKPPHGSPEQGASVSTAELLESYNQFAVGQGWTPKSEGQFFREVGDVLLAEFHLAQRRDIERSRGDRTTMVRGWRHLTFRARYAPEGWDGVPFPDDHEHDPDGEPA